MRQRPEQAIHQQIAAFLRLALGGTATFFHIPNAAKRGFVEGRIFKTLGVVAGTPDLCILDSGKAFFVEIKSAKGRVSEAQESAHKDLKRAGCPVCIARSIDDVAAFLERHGIAVKARLA